MKKIFILTMMVWIGVVANANNVDQNTAKAIGKKFLKVSANMRFADNEELQLVTTYNTSGGEAAFYIFNSNNGFVIVSAVDCAIPILGYSNENVFSEDNIPIQMEEYLKHFVEQIQYGVENNLVADEATAHQWELVRTTGRISDERETSAVTPLLTDTWNQDCYYNNLCPSAPMGPCGHVYAGCAATSLSQIMRYWGYPETGTGTHTYTPPGYPQQTANFGETTYQWNDMPNSLSSSSSETQINAVATLMWHCGVAIDMEYGVLGSGANPTKVATALTNYFGYATSLYTAYKPNYTNAQWLAIIKTDLDNERPIHYSGWDSEGENGHSFVCDGYDSNDMLHFNWGWSGQHNNYYALDALTPPNGYNFSYTNFAILNIRPNNLSYQVTASANPSEGGTVAFGSKDNRGTTTYDFDDSSMSGWTTIDADGDDRSWVLGTTSFGGETGHGHNASNDLVLSQSYENGVGVLYPDNFLVSPSKAEYSSISFYACAQDASWAAEHFGVAVSTTSNTDATAFTTIQEWTMTAKGVPASGQRGNRDQGNWYQYTVDLSEYAGQEIWVAIRHFNCSDWYFLDVDDITLTTGGGGVAPISAPFTEGQSCTVIATPSDGYQFVNWTENGSQVSTDASYTFTVNSNRTLVANFIEQQSQTYTVSVSANPSNGGNVTGNGTYNQGQQCTLTATPNPGFNFFNWVKDGVIVSTDATYTFTVTENAEYIANFSYIEYEVLTSVDPENGGTITKVGDNHYGSEVTLTVTPAENFVFQNWTENGEVVSEELSFTFTLTDSHHFIAHLVDISGVGENAQQVLNIYPNPVNDKLFIEANETISNVEIYNLTGGMVLSQECNSDKVEIAVSELQSGVYFIKMFNGNSIETRSFVKK